MSVCKKCGKEFDGENIYCTSCRWHMKWPDEILNAPELASRRKRSHNIKIISIDRENATAEIKATHGAQNYITTLGSCTCKDFALNHAEIPCKHILRLAEELNLFKNEKFSLKERDYTLNLTLPELPPEKKILPVELRDQNEEVILRYIEVLRFFYLGRKNKILQLEKRLNEIESQVSKLKELSPKEKKLRYKIIEELGIYNQLSSHSRVIKRYKRVGEYDPALKKLHDLKIIKIDNSELYSTVVMPAWLSLHKLEQTLKIYGFYLPSFLQKVSENCETTLYEIISSGRRSEMILRPYDAKATPNWAFCVPEYFNDALDIKLTSRVKNSVKYSAWTQGVNFSFDRGYILYRNCAPDFNKDPAIQIISAKKAFGTIKERLDLKKNDEEEYLDYYPRECEEGENYYPGEVVFRDFSTNTVETMTQFDFVKMLIGIN